jgi:glutamate/tyrosine decarboxylase-like PLP-dependent enzyme
MHTKWMYMQVCLFTGDGVGCKWIVAFIGMLCMILKNKIMTKQNKNVTNESPLAAWFLGPKAEHASTWIEIINYIFQDYVHWRRNYFPEDQVVVDRTERRDHEIWFDKLNSNIDQLLNSLKAHYPFYSPRYLAHMLSEQSLPSVAGYIAGMLYNPNNVTDEAAPITVELELEVGKMISEMLGFDNSKSWSHITSGGTIANLEAFWGSRISLVVPLIIQEFCISQKIDYDIKLPNGNIDNIRNTDKLTLLHLVPNESLFMPRKFIKYIIEEIGKPETIISKFNEHFSKSKYNINSNGLNDLFSELKIEPIILISESAHYCFKKIGSLIGIGHKSIHSVGVDSQFRIDIAQLEKKLFNLRKNQIVLGVVGIVGTTEEGAIDPIHEIFALRQKFEKEKNRSFWFHIDAAWGGYIRTILHQEDSNGKLISLDLNTRGDEEIFEQYYSSKAIEEEFNPSGKTIRIDWKDPDLFKSLLYMSQADSITIDPHKLGYVPYPSGVICFKNGLITELFTQEAPYISDQKIGFNSSIDKPIIRTNVGPYIIEGSKPGAAAASTWLAHKTIPLNNKNHGKIIRTSLLNTRKLYTYIGNHRRRYKEFENELFGVFNPDEPAFTFEPLYEPDSNVLCYIAVPYMWSNQKFVRRDVSLQYLNKLNQSIYKKFSISSFDGKHKMPYSQEYFVSRTTLKKDTYKSTSIDGLLSKFGIKKDEYNKYGIFVLRSTIMNPWYFHAVNSNNGLDYLSDFIKKLHYETKLIIKSIENHT